MYYIVSMNVVTRTIISIISVASVVIARYQLTTGESVKGTAPWLLSESGVNLSIHRAPFAPTLNEPSPLQCEKSARRSLDLNIVERPI